MARCESAALSLFGVLSLLFLAVSGVTGFASQIQKGEGVLISGWQVRSVSEMGPKVYPVLSLPRSGTYTDWHWLATNYPASFLPWALLAQISIHNYTAQIDKMCFFKWNSQSSGCTLPFCTTNNSAARYFNKQEVGQYIIALKSQWNICLLPCRSTEVVESVAKPYSIRFRRPFLHSLGASRLASLIQIVIGCHKSCTATD